jgi:hypothetical protein
MQSSPTLFGACTSCPGLHEKIVELQSRIISLEADLKVHIPTSYSTCELHAVKNLELAQCVGHLQDENNKLCEVLSWLSSQEPQLGMMIGGYKRFDGWALGSDKFGESSGEREGNFGNIPVPPKPTPKDKFAPKPNKLLKPRENPSEKACKKPSLKPCEEPHPKHEPKPIRFHCEFCGKDGHKREFFYKRKREARMAKVWANKDRYHPSHGVPESRMPLPKGKGFVHKVLPWGDRSSRSRGGGLERAVRPAWLGGQTGPAQGGQSDRSGKAVRPALPRFLGSSTFEVVMLVVSVPLVMVRMVGALSLVVLCLLDDLHLVTNTRLGEVTALRLRGATDHTFPFVVLVLLQREGSGFPMMVPGLIGLIGWIAVVIGTVEWILLTPLSRRCLETGLTLFALTPVLSRLLALALGFKLQVGGSENIWLISGVVL